MKIGMNKQNALTVLVLYVLAKTIKYAAGLDGYFGGSYDWIAAGIIACYVIKNPILHWK